MYAVAERNVECWLRADPGSLASALGLDAGELAQVEDPKGMVEGALRPLTTAQKVTRIEQYVASADLAEWIEASRSFEAFH